VVMPQILQTVKTTLNNVSAEVNAMIDAATNKGDLNFHIDPDKYKGDWRKIMIGLNHVAEAVDAPIVEIRDVMNLLAQGKFANARVTGDYKGDFLVMGDSVNKMIDTLNNYLDEVAEILDAISIGDLTKSIQREYIGEFDSLKKPINNISETLNKTMTEISTASGEVFSGAKQISISSQELANGAQRQASSAEELHATIDTVNQQTRQNADDAMVASEISNRSTANAKEGNESMKEMVAAMSQIKDSSGEISKIIKAIQDIAFQTNLLALNAAVEAARAGEHGKGFSVVAEEVRSLAGRSQESATETTGLIETSNNRVESGSRIATATSQSFDMIVKNASEVSALISNISIASKEQAEAVAQISEGLSQISNVTQNTSAVSQETAAASQELSAQAEILQQLVMYFKL